MRIAGHRHFTSAAESEATMATGNIELALRIEIPPASTNGAAPHLSHHIIHISMRLFET